MSSFSDACPCVYAINMHRCLYVIDACRWACACIINLHLCMYVINTYSGGSGGRRAAGGWSPPPSLLCASLPYTTMHVLHCVPEYCFLHRYVCGDYPGVHSG